MRSRLLSFSFGLNLILMVIAGFWCARNYSHRNTPQLTGQIRLTEKSAELAAVPTVGALPAPLRWSELESDDYRTYIANLRKVGCPEPVLRRVIGADLNELYARKAFFLVQEFHRDFWEIAARENVRGYFEKTLGQQVKALCQEPDALLKELLGEAPHALERVPKTSAPEKQLIEFLSPAKQERLRQLAESNEMRLQTALNSNLSLEEKKIQSAKLRQELDFERVQIFSPEEWSEYQLRQSAAASELQQLYGVDFSETEMRNLAKAIDDYQHRTDSEAETDPETLDQKLQSVLEPTRFKDFKRARSASYRTLYEVAADFGLPSDTAAAVFDLRIESEKQSEEIRIDKSRPSEEKQALLDTLQERVEQAILTKFGGGAYQSYKIRDGRWISYLSRL